MPAFQSNTLTAYRNGDCECRPCPDCEGEGEIETYITVGYSAAGLPRQVRDSYACRACNGTGTDSGDCAIHEPREPECPSGAFDPRFGITAAQLGIEPEICEACNAGDHELPRIAPCACACHGETRRAA